MQPRHGGEEGLNGGVVYVVETHRRALGGRVDGYLILFGLLRAEERRDDAVGAQLDVTVVDDGRRRGGL